MIAQPHFAVEPWAVTRGRRSTSTCSPSRVGLRALQRPHRAARQPRRGRAVRPARAPTSTRFYEARPLPVRRGRLRLPGGRPDRRQRHQRQAHPPARRRRALRRALRRAARARAHARPARRRAAPRGRTGARRRAARSRCARRGWSPSCSARSPRSATRSSRSTATTRIVVQSELVANEPVPAPQRATRARPPRCARRWSPRTHGTHELRAVLVHRTRASGLRMAAAMDHVVDGPDGHGDREREPRRPRRA